MSESSYTKLERLGTVVEDFAVISIQAVTQRGVDCAASMKEAIRFLKSYVPTKIPTTLKCSCVKASKDQRLIFFGTKQGHVGLVDTESQQVISVEKLSVAAFQCITLSNDERHLYIGGNDSKIKKLLATDFTEVFSFEGHSDSVNDLLITPDGKFMISGSSDNTVRMWLLELEESQSSVIHSEEYPIWCIDLSSNGKYLAIAGQGSRISIYDISAEPSPSLLQSIATDSSIKTLKFSPLQFFLVTGNADGFATMYDFETWTVLQSFKHSSPVYSIDISENETVIITGAADHTIKVWDTKGKHEEYELHGHNDTIRSCIISNDQKSIISGSYDGFIIIWRVPSFESEKKWRCKNFEPVQVWYSNEENRLEAIGRDEQGVGLVYWDVIGNQNSVISLAKRDFPSVCLYADGEVLAFYPYKFDPNDAQDAGVTDDEVYFVLDIYKVATAVKQRTHLLKADIKSAFVTEDKKHCVTGELYKFSIWDYSNFTKIYTLLCFRKEVVYCCTDQFFDLLFAYSRERIVKMFDLKGLAEEEKNLSMAQSLQLEDKGDDLKCKIEISSDNQFLYILQEKRLSFVEIRSFLVVKVVDLDYLGIVKSVKDTLLVYSGGGIDIYSEIDFQLICEYRKRFRIENLILSADQTDLYIFHRNSFYRTGNPLLSKNLKLVGNSTMESSFLRYVHTIFSKNCKDVYKGPAWLIEPTHVNILNVYAYYNLFQFLEAALLNNTPYLKSTEGWTPLTLCLKYNFNESVHSIVKSLRALSKDTNDISHCLTINYLQTDLIALNLSGYTGLQKLYSDIFIQETYTHQPPLCSSDIALPVVQYSDFIFPDSADFEISKEIPEDTTSVKYLRSLLKFNMELGSTESLEFMNSLVKCPNRAIFDTELISLILNEKWVLARRLMIYQAIIYMIYLFGLVLYSAIPESSWILAIPFTLNIILYLYESVFIFLGPLAYFSSFWNIIDSTRAISIMIYIILEWTDTIFHNEGFLAFALAISWFRGITYFRVNSKTRYLINLVFQVCRDIIPFFVIFIYSTVGFGLIFGSLQQNGHNPGANFINSYMISMGSWDYPTEETRIVEIFILILVTLINPIVIINLLVSILSDTFEQVEANNVIADGRELTDMIIEIETLMYWRRGENEKKYIHMVDEENIDVQEMDDIEQIAKNMKSRVDAIESEIALNQEIIGEIEKLHVKKSQELFQCITKLYENS